MGSTNRVNDCLIRPPVETLTMVIKYCFHENSRWPNLYESDPEFAPIDQDVCAGKLVAEFHIQEGFLWHLVHIYVPSSEHVKIIWEDNYSRVARNFGTEKTMAVLHKYFYWPKLWQDIGWYIKPFTSHAITKPTIKKQGLYTSLPTSNGPCESIFMDYMSGLPSIKHGNDCLFVFVDRFSKMVILIACKKNISAEATTKLFFKHVWVHFGFPQTIISDQDSQFLTTFWSIIWSLVDTKLTKLTDFHPKLMGKQR